MSRRRAGRPSDTLEVVRGGGGMPQWLMRLGPGVAAVLAVAEAALGLQARVAGPVGAGLRPGPSLSRTISGED